MSLNNKNEDNTKIRHPMNIIKTLRFQYYMRKEIKTPWGRIIPEVSLFPIYYLLFIYCFVYILPFGKAFIGISWFDWFRSEDGPLEWIQFVEYALASFLALMIFFKQKSKRLNFEK